MSSQSLSRLSSGVKCLLFASSLFASAAAMSSDALSMSADQIPTRATLTFKGAAGHSAVDAFTSGHADKYGNPIQVLNGDAQLRWANDEVAEQYKATPRCWMEASHAPDYDSSYHLTSIDSEMISRGLQMRSVGPGCHAGASGDDALVDTSLCQWHREQKQVRALVLTFAKDKSDDSSNSIRAVCVTPSGGNVPTARFLADQLWSRSPDAPAPNLDDGAQKAPVARSAPPSSADQ